jgi:hypothetical protein
MKDRPRSLKVIVIVAALVVSNLALAAATMAQGEQPGGDAGSALPLDSSQVAPKGPASQQGSLYITRVFVSSPADVLRLVNGGWDVLEARGPDYLLVMADDATIAALQAEGFRTEIEQTITTAMLPDQQVGTMTYYGGYRTVVEHNQHLDAVVANYPALARVFDYGDSWRKVNNIPNGNDLRAICITANAAGNCALTPAGSKPRFLLMAAIHARELTTAEVAYRWIDYLTQNYNVDADVTWLLDNNEMWVVPVVNPDGRLIVESGGNNPYTQRKNANTSLGNCSNPPTSSSQYGVDLNRNASTDNYGGAGTSTNPCSLTYRGVSAASEPEEFYLETLFQQLFADTKGPNRNDPAATNTQGAFITLHSYSNLVLLPYGDATTGGYAPNDAALRSFAFRMSNYNAYQTGTGDEVLYPTTGTTDDWIYGRLGVPGFTFELGPSSGSCSGFTPSYSCVDGTFWPLNRPALLYAAKVARDPYTVTFGPTTGAPTLSASTVSAGTPVTLNANTNDNAYGNASGSVGRPAAQAINAAEYYIDTPPWTGGTAIAMNAADGSFNATSENVTASINTTGLSEGRHTIFVRGRDAGGNWGPVSAAFLTISATSPTPTPTATATATPGGGSTTLGTTADASVRAGINANTNYGSASTMTVRTSSSANNTRWTYVKFDTSSVAGAVTNARIRLYGSNSSGGSIGMTAYAVSNTAWGESTITWNNRPAAGAAVSGNVTSSSTAGQYYEWDITAYVQSERAAGRNIISVVIQSPTITSIAFNASTKEAASNRPQLVITQ